MATNYEAQEFDSPEAEKALKAKQKKGNFLTNMSKTQQYLLYGALGAAALYGGAKVPFVRKVALPFLATAATKNWGALMGKFQRA